MSLILPWWWAILAGSSAGCVSVEIVSILREGRNWACAGHVNRHTGRRGRKYRQNNHWPCRQLKDSKPCMGGPHENRGGIRGNSLTCMKVATCRKDFLPTTHKPVSLSK